MALLIECPNCKTRNSVKQRKCTKCNKGLPARKECVYWVRAYDGSGKRRLYRAVTKAKAIEIEKDIKMSRIEGRLWKNPRKTITTSGSTALKFLMEEFLEDSKLRKVRDLRNRRKCLNGIVKNFGENLNAESLGKEFIYEFQSKRLRQGVTGSTINRQTVYLHGMLAFAQRRGYIEENPIKGYKKLKENPPRNRVLEEWEFRAIEAALDSPYKEIFQVRYYLPMRDQETLRLRWKQVNLEDERGYIRFSGQGDQETKSGRPRVVPFYHPEVRAVFQNMEKGNPEDLVFGHRGNVRPHWRNPFVKALREAGVTNFRATDLKHCAVTELLLSGVPEAEVQHAADHNSPIITGRYTNVTMDRILLKKVKYFNPKTGVIEPLKTENDEEGEN